MRTPPALRLRRPVAAIAAAVIGTVVALTPALPAQADAVRNQQWYLAALDVPAAHALSQGEGVTVAVIDTGVDASHPDLTGNVEPGLDAETGSGDGRQDPVGHGTAMAALIAGHGHGTDGADGVLGIAPRARILPVKVQLNVGRVGGATAALVKAIDYAVAQGATVINASIRGDLAEPLRQAILRALDRGVVIVAASGNQEENDGVMGAPAYYPGVVAVCATDRSGQRAAFSVPAQGLAELTVCAPGVDLTSTTPGGGYGSWRGTSGATALVSGAVALIRSKYPQMPAYEVVNRLGATATDLGSSGRDKQTGYGRLNLTAALTANVPPPPSPKPWITRSATPTPPAAASAAAQPQPDTDQGLPGGVLFGVGAAILALAALAWIAVRRRNRRGTTM